jgi:hypothetical protein
LRATISGGSIAQGQDHWYFLDLTNATEAPVSLRQCPTYRQTLQPKLPGQGNAVTLSNRLNCDRPAIAPGETVHYQMRLRLPADQPAGDYTLFWAITDGPAGSLVTTVRPS